MKSRLILSLCGLYLTILCGRGAESYNVTMAPPGYTLFANQLDLSPDDYLSTSALGQMLPNKSQLVTWDAPSQTFVAYTKAFGAWSADTHINPGKAFYCKLPPTAATPLTIQLSGASVSPVAIPGFSPTTLYYLLGSQRYDSTLGATYTYSDITATSPVAGESLFRARNAVPGGIPISSIPTTSPADWNEYLYDGTAWHLGWSMGPVMTSPSEPQIVLGEGVWIGPPLGEIQGRAVSGNSGLKSWEIALSDGRYTFTDANGHYGFDVIPGDYTVTLIPPCGWDTLVGLRDVTVTNQGQVVTVHDLTATPQINPSTGPDLAVIIIYVPDPGNPIYPCPNDTGSYVVYYYNKCVDAKVETTLTVILSTYVTYGSTVNPTWSQSPPVGVPAATLLAITPTPPIPPTTLSWKVAALPANAVGEIRIPVTVSSLVQTTRPVTSMSTIATISPVGTDPNLANNTENLQTPTRCAFDPNDKTVEPAGCGPTGLINGDQLLTYTVQFQNLGSAPAFDVVVTDQLDSNLDPSTLKILGASHNYVFQLNGNQMTWTFPDIYLPDAADDEPGSHGFIRYQVKPLPGLADGTVITNQASIVFDKNPPVLTAITTNTITSATLPVASFTVTPQPGSAGHTNDFTYTGGTPGATFLWDFGPDAIPPTSTNMNPAGVVFPTDGMRTVTLQVFSGDCDATPAGELVGVGRPTLKIASTTGNQVVLSWDREGYSLLEADTLNAPIPWQVISPSLTQVGITSFATLEATNTMRYYRLTDQP